MATRGLLRLAGLTFCLALSVFVVGFLGCATAVAPGSSAPAGGFTLTANPATVSLQPGTSSQVSVLATASGAFSSPVTVAVSGLPAGMTATPATLTLNPGAAQTLTLTAAATAAASTGTLTLTGTSGSITETTTVAVSVALPPADFTLSASPATASLMAGGASTTFSLTASALNGFTGTVAVAITGLPAGVTASPAALSLTPGVPQTVTQTMTLSAASGTAPGTATVSFTGTSGSLLHTATVALTLAAPPPDFTLSVSPTSAALVAGGAGSMVSLLVAPVNGFTGTVAVALGGLPAGVTASPATLSLTPGTAQTVTLTAASTATAGAATITFAGTSGTLSHTATVALTVSPVPDFSLALTPSTQSLTPGGSAATVSVLASALNGFTGAVAIAITGLPTGVTASPATLTLTPGIAQTVTISAAATSSAGSALLGFTGTAGTLTHAATLALTVAAAPDFTLALTPSAQNVTAGNAGATVSVLASALNGFTGTVAVAITGLPTGVTASPATLTLAPGLAQTVTISAASTASAGVVVVGFAGTSGTLTHTATLALTVAAAAGDFSLAVTPPVESVTDGGTGVTVSVLASAVNGFTGPILVAIGGLPTGVAASPASLNLTPGVAQTVTLSSADSTTAATANITFTGTSGTLSHSASLALTLVAAPQDFTLALTPTTQSLTAGGASATISVLATGSNGFSSSVAVALTGLPSGVTATPVTLSLTPGTAQTVSLSAATNATVGSATATFTGTSGTLSHTATLALTVAAATGPDVTTYHYDNTRDGVNAQEMTLTLANVNSTSFGLRNTYTVDGKVDAQPLYVGGLTIGTGAAARVANVLYVATEHDSVYALDAATGTQQWKVSVLGTGETTSDAHGCNQISPEIGITSTPVIDRTHGPNGTIFVIGMSKDASGNYHQRLHALDLTTGAELPGSPTEITATYPGTGDNSQNGNVIFAPGQYAERVGLLLLNGSIYTGWTSHCDIQPYTGWVMGFSESTLAQTSLLNLTPNGEEGSIWMSGFGLGADTAGSIYLLDANGTLDNAFNASGYPSASDFGNAMLKLSTANGLAVSDYFEPYNSTSESSQDIDLGSGGAMLLPDLTDNAGVVHHLLVGAGKDHNIYVANRDYMGKFNPANNMQLYQQISGALPNGAWSGPAYFNNTVFFGGNGDVLRAFTITDALLSTSPASISSTSFTYPGTTPSVSANGTENGIVWAVESGTGSAAVLHAYDATNLAHELYNSNQAPNGRDAFGLGNKFITPMVTNGMVFVGTPTGVAVFGLLP